MKGKIIGLRMPDSRHVANLVYATAAADNAAGAAVTLCGLRLDPGEVKRQVIEKISPAVLCPRCVEVARRWYAAGYFVTWDITQRRRLLEAIEWDLKAVA